MAGRGTVQPYYDAVMASLTTAAVPAPPRPRIDGTRAAITVCHRFVCR